MISLLSLALSLASVTAQTASLSSQIDLLSVERSIRQYATPGNWNSAMLSNLQTYLTASMYNNPQVATSPTASATANCTIANPYNATSIANIVKTCSNILVSNLTVPAGQTLNLGTSKTGATITFQGHTTFGFNASNYNLVQFKGSNLIVQGAAGHVIDGSGQQWWDGLGSNGGTPKPDHMFTVGVTGFGLFKNLYIKNAPTHVFSISNSQNLYMVGNVIDMIDGGAILSNGLEAAHNTDGYDLSTTTNSILSNNVVYNQDDCVALTSGVNVLFNNFYCSGGHGMSIGSVGGKSNNTVSQITFNNSMIVNSQNGARIKANSNTTGSIDRVTYQNIQISNISIYGIDIQQDYLNGGPTGMPTPGVNITNIAMNVKGTVQSTAQNYYLLVATPSTNGSTWDFTGSSVTGGMNSACDTLPAAPSGFVCGPTNVNTYSPTMR